MNLSKNYSNTSDFVSILKSHYLSEKVLKNLKLENYKELISDDEENSFQAKLERFQKKVKVISPTGKDTTIKIKVRLKDKLLAEKIANRYFQELNSYLEETNYLSSTRNRKFIEAQLNRIFKELKVYENQLLKFKSDNKTVSLPDEISEYIKYLSDLEVQELKSKMELKDLNERLKESGKNFSEFNLEWKNIIKDMQVAQAGLKTREGIIQEAKNKYANLLNSLPLKALTLAGLEREIKVKNSLYLVFSQQLELAKLEEAKENEPFKILDKAYSQSKPVFPDRPLIISISILFGILSSILLSFFIEFLKVEKRKYSESVISEKS